MKKRPAAKLFLCFVTGLILARYFPVRPDLLFGLCAFTLLSAVAFLKIGGKTRLVIDALIAMSLILLACIRYELRSTYLPQNHVVNFTDFYDKLELQGVIVSYPDKRSQAEKIVIEARHLWHREQTATVRGRILVTARFPDADFNYGDEIRISGKLRRPRDRRNPGEFDYRDYLMAQNIFAVMTLYRPSQVTRVAHDRGNRLFTGLILPVKRYLDEFIAAQLPPKESALLHGLMIGERGAIAPNVRQQFADAGVIHLLAVSGLHVGFILLIFLGVFGFFRLPYAARVVLAIAGLAFYACLTNLKPPVVRASIMATILLLGTLLERKTDIYNTLAIAAVSILVINPLEFFQPGFQLSFAAVVAIVYIYPKIKSFCGKFLPTQRLMHVAFSRYLLELFYVSAAALIGTLPFTLYYFHRLPAYSLFTNMLVIPLAFGALATGLVAAACSLFSAFIAHVYMNAAWLCLSALLKIVQEVTTLPLSHLDVFRFSLLHGLVYTVALICVLNFGQVRVRRLFVIFLLILANGIAWKNVFAGKPALQVVFLDVGQGDACLISTPDGRHLLIDGGPRGRDFDAGRWTILPYLKRVGIDRLDALLLTHGDADHLGGFPTLLRHVKVAEVWDNGQTKDTWLYRDYQHLLDSLHVHHRILTAYQEIDTFSPVKIFVLHPTRDFEQQFPDMLNESSVAIKLCYGEDDFLFVGDVEHRGEAELARLAGFLDSEVLKVAHHGSNTSSTTEFLRWVHPHIAVISVGQFNKFKHPSPEVLRRLKAQNASILRTDQNGAVILQSDGHTLHQIHWR